jgi:hypothetical protein
MEPFQSHYSENLVAPGIEPEPLDLWPGTLTFRPQKSVIEGIVTKITGERKRL